MVMSLKFNYNAGMLKTFHQRNNNNQRVKLKHYGKTILDW